MFLISTAIAGTGIDVPLRTGARTPEDAALVVGIEDYASAGVPDVPYAEADAQAVYDLFRYTRGIPGERITLLTGEVSRDAIQAEVRRLGAQVGRGGTLFVYFAGHGGASPVDGARLLVGWDARPDPSSFVERSVAVDDLRRFGGVGGGQVVIVVDACYGGVGRDGTSKIAGARWVVPVTSGASEWVAAGPNEVAAPLDDRRHGAFTWLWVGALRGWADGVLGSPDGVVTGDEAQAYVERGLLSLQRRGQTPTMAPELGSLVFTRGASERGPELRIATVAPAPSGAVRAWLVVGGGVAYGGLDSLYWARSKEDLVDGEYVVSEWAAQHVPVMDLRGLITGEIGFAPTPWLGLSIWGGAGYGRWSVDELAFNAEGSTVFEDAESTGVEWNVLFEPRVELALPNPSVVRPHLLVGGTVLTHTGWDRSQLHDAFPTVGRLLAFGPAFGLGAQLTLGHFCVDAEGAYTSFLLTGASEEGTPTDLGTPPDPELDDPNYLLRTTLSVGVAF